MSGWLDDLEPLEPEDSARQVEALLARLGPAPRRVLDLGCGHGRALIPLAEAGHELTGVDRDAGHLALCREAAGALPVRLIEADFLEPWPADLRGGRFDAVCCLGNTMMTIVDPADAVELLRQSAAALAPSGMFVMDDCPQRFWPELTEGNWQSGLSPDGSMQLVWADDDAVFALRAGDDVDPDVWTLRPSDVRFRLWTMAALQLAAANAGLSADDPPMGEGLLIIRPAEARPG